MSTETALVRQDLEEKQEATHSRRDPVFPARTKIVALVKSGVLH